MRLPTFCRLFLSRVQVISHVSGLLVAVLAGTVAHIFDYRGLYIAETVVAIVSLIYVLSAFKKEQ